jgi:hypothetical protein
MRRFFARVEELAEAEIETAARDAKRSRMCPPAS